MSGRKVVFVRRRPSLPNLEFVGGSRGDALSVIGPRNCNLDQSIKPEDSIATSGRTMQAVEGNGRDFLPLEAQQA